MPITVSPLCVNYVALCVFVPSLLPSIQRGVIVECASPLSVSGMVIQYPVFIGPVFIFCTHMISTVRLYG